MKGTTFLGNSTHLEKMDCSHYILQVVGTDNMGINICARSGTCITSEMESDMVEIDRASVESEIFVISKTLNFGECKQYVKVNTISPIVRKPSVHTS